MTHPSGAAWATRLADQPSTPARGKMVDGQVEFGGGVLTLAAMCTGGMMMHLDLEKGYLQPGHTHPDNESLGYVVTGRLRMVVDGVEAVLEPGDGWFHPKGSWHITEALEDSTGLEIHIPLRPDILERLQIDPPAGA
jgi:quercetin dioxygenase-like cupin family protein